MIKCPRGLNCNEGLKCPSRHEQSSEDPMSKVRKEIEDVIDQIKESKEKLIQLKEIYCKRKEITKIFICVKCKDIPEKCYLIFECLHLLCGNCYPNYKVLYY